MSSFNSLARKLVQLVDDPVLRKWTVMRLASGQPIAPKQQRLPVPYLEGVSCAGPVQALAAPPSSARPDTPIELRLPGEEIRLQSGEEKSLFTRRFDDLETLLALHRFAWLGNSDPAPAAAWVRAIWDAWAAHFGQVEEGWAWHPYTVAERLINITRFANAASLPKPYEVHFPSLDRHGPAILERLEYFGQSDTGNHLANNGRGLFLGGLAVDRPDWVEIGGKILLNEARRMFAPSGVLREGSSHYHLLCTLWFWECACAASAHGLGVADQLAEIAQSGLRVAGRLNLPGGLPLIGDVSPDFAPDRLINLLPEFPQLLADTDKLAADGWLRIEYQDWSILAFASPAGWAPLPGHGHSDFGSFELHHRGTPIVRDLGRRSYGESGNVDVEAMAHNSLTIDGEAPYPQNKPYYTSEFRERVAGQAPLIRRTDQGFQLSAFGFRRLGRIQAWHRDVTLSSGRVTITDRLEGRGHYRVERRLHTTQPVKAEGEDVRLGMYRVHTNGPIGVEAARRWHSYGESQPATAVVVTNKITLPWTTSLTLTPA